MTMWKKNLGTSLMAGGTVLMGIGVVPQLSGLPSKVLTYVALAGFVLMAVGTIFSHLFAQDTAKVVKQIQNEQPMKIYPHQTYPL